MAEWWESYGVEVIRKDDCWYCFAPLEGDTLFVPRARFGTRGRTSLMALAVCRLCQIHELALIEAKDECRKFTSVELERCVCGRAMLTSIGRCVTCHRERRMLAVQWREIKLTRRILSSIKKEIKRGKAIDGRTPGASV